MDAFERWWQWAQKPLDCPLTIPAEIHRAVTCLPPQDRRDRNKVNEAVRKTTEAMIAPGDKAKALQRPFPGAAIRIVARGATRQARPLLEYPPAVHTSV